MSPELFCQTMFDHLLTGESVGSLVLRSVAIVGLAGAGIFLRLPRGEAKGGRQAERLLGGALATIALVLLVTARISANFANGAATLLWPMPDTTVNAGFFAFAAVSLVAAVMMITARNPVYSALWFAVVLLSNAGLFFLQGAEFLAAATIIIYAGAIIVTFLFVIMLAQPRGTAPYDRRSREPVFTCVAGVLFAAALVGTIHFAARTEGNQGGPTFLPGYQQTQQHVRLRQASVTWPIDPAEPHVKSLGKTLYLDHVVSVEVIGLLLLAAVVGAMLIAGHKISPDGEPERIASS